MSQSVQELIHNLEVGAGRKTFFVGVAVALLIAMAVLFDTFFYRNLTTNEGMEAAQLARNIAEGKGYVSGVMRPLAIRLLQNTEKPADLRIKDVSIPDLQTPPVYPVLLSGWLKLLPWKYRIIGDAATFRNYKPDLWITIFHQLFLLFSIFLVYRLGTRLFDTTAGGMSAALLAGTWLYWQMAFTGHGGLILVVFGLLLAHCLLSIEEHAAAETPSGRKVLLWAALAGACVAFGALTRYSFLWVIIPVFVYTCFIPAPNRLALPLVAVGTFLIIFTPWMVRNITLSGAPFGTASHAIYAGTETFPGDDIERALYPKFQSFDYHEVRRKFITNTREMLSTDLPKFGGNWIALISLVGLLLPFRRPALNRLRWFAVGAVLILFFAQAGGRTQLTKDNPDVTVENLLSWMAPICMVFGVGFVISLVDQITFTHPAQRPLLLGVIAGVCCTPFLSSVLPPYPYISAIVYPPYFPPVLQRIGRMSDDGLSTRWGKEMVMSDIPAAITWYSRCAAAPLSLNYKADSAEKVKDDFFELSDYRREVKALYMTQRSLKDIPVKGVVDNGKDIQSKWDNFLAHLIIHRKVPEGFPLQGWADWYWPEQLYLEVKVR